MINDAKRADLRLLIGSLYEADELHEVQVMLKDQRDLLGRRVSTGITVGSRVEFAHKKHGVMQGVVTKVNQKTVSVTVDTWTLFTPPIRWKVYLSSLKVI